MNLVNCIVDERLDPLLSEVYYYAYNNGDANHYDRDVSAHSNYLSHQRIEGDPGIYVNNGPEKDTDKLIIVWHIYKVLIRHGDTGCEIHNQNNPCAYLRVTHHSE